MLIAFVVLYLAVSIAIGLWAATRVRDSRDYIVAGRRLPLYIVTATVFATWKSGAVSSCAKAAITPST